MSSNRVRRPNSRATRNEDKPDPCEVKHQQGTRKQRTMFCRNCGAQIADQAVMCPKCGTPVAGRSNLVNGSTSIPNHLVGSILATIFCCMPFGIPAIVYAAKVNSLIAAGDIDGAMKASKTANTWMLVSVTIGVIVALFYGICGAIGAASN